MTQRKVSLIGTAALLLIVACASSGSGGASTSERIEAPRMITGGSAPELRIPTTSSGSGRSPVRVKIQVLIDESGRPDMSTFKATGVGAAENREALQRWVEQAIFQPGRRGGIPTASVYHMVLEARVQVRRM